MVLPGSTYGTTFTGAVPTIEVPVTVFPRNMACVPRPRGIFEAQQLMTAVMCDAGSISRKISNSIRSRRLPQLPEPRDQVQQQTGLLITKTLKLHWLTRFLTLQRGLKINMVARLGPRSELGMNFSQGSSNIYRLQQRLIAPVPKE